VDPFAHPAAAVGQQLFRFAGSVNLDLPAASLLLRT
jgi:hypothetical protein